ncbi:MAG: hypothetical protein AAGU12_00055 [Clostridiales bacterium]
MERATFSLTGNDLLNSLTINALDLFYVIGDPDDSEVSMLESAISLVAEAWDLSQEILAKSKTLIAAEREATRCEAQGEPAPQPTEEKIPEHHADCTPISVLWGLFETATRLDTKDKQVEIFNCARFLAEYMGLEEWLTDPRCTAA